MVQDNSFYPTCQKDANLQQFSQTSKANNKEAFRTAWAELAVKKHEGEVTYYENLALINDYIPFQGTIYIELLQLCDFNLGVIFKKLKQFEKNWNQF